MNGTALTWLADVLRAAGLDVVEDNGWQTRSRSSGGFTGGRPWGITWHHTASNPGSDGQSDVNFIARGSSVAPVYQLYVNRAGRIWTIAAGAANHAGSGGPWSRWSAGTVPTDAMNTHGIALALANNGVGEPYPAAQINTAFTASLAISRRLGRPVVDVVNHRDWTTRKIDMATAAAVQGGWRPASTNTSGTWSLADLQAELTRRDSAAIIIPEDDDMTPEQAAQLTRVEQMLNQLTADWPADRARQVGATFETVSHQAEIWPPDAARQLTATFETVTQQAEIWPVDRANQVGATFVNTEHLLDATVGPTAAGNDDPPER